MQSSRALLLETGRRKVEVECPEPPGLGRVGEGEGLYLQDCDNLEEARGP